MGAEPCDAGARCLMSRLTVYQAGLRLGRSDPEAARFVIAEIRRQLSAPVPDDIAERGYGEAYQIGRADGVAESILFWIDAGANQAALPGRGVLT